MSDYPIQPKLLMNSRECLLNLSFGLSFATNSEIRSLIENHYLLEQLAYPDNDTQARMMQTIANEKKDLYNNLYRLIGYSELFENPLENYDRQEHFIDESEVNSSGNALNTYDEVPMEENNYKKINKTDTKTTGTNKQKNEHTARIHGNIGVMTLAKAEQETEEMYKRLYNLKNNYVKEYSKCFLITP